MTNKKSPIISITLTIALLPIINSVFIFPFEKVNRITNQSDTPANIIAQLRFNSVKTKVKIGTPFQELNLHATTDKSYSYVISEDATIYEGEERYSFFYHNSSSYKVIEEYMVFDEGSITGNDINETLTLDKNNVINNFKLFEAVNCEFEFKPYSDAGMLGIGIREETGCSYKKFNIIQQLKDRDVINTYDYFIHYKEKGKGVIGIGGDMATYIDSYKSYKKELDRLPKSSVPGESLMLGFTINEITYDDEPIFTGFVKAQLSLDHAVIQGNEKIKNILDRDLFEVLLKDKKCESVIVKDKSFRGEDDVLYYYCKKGAVDKSKLLNLQLRNNEMNTTFEIELKDLFETVGDREYFMMSFNLDTAAERDTIILGEPFLRKYTFNFNKDDGVVFYYNDQKKIKDDDDGDDKSTTALIVVCVLAVVIIAGLGYFAYCLWKKQPRKLRATEMPDENYEYVKSNN